MASNLLTKVNASISNCDSEADEGGILSIGVQFDNFGLNEELKNTQSLLLKDIKRPSLAIYRPGMGLLHKHGQKTNDSDEERAPDGEENHDEIIWSSALNTGSPDLSMSDSKALIKDMNNLKISTSTFKKKNDHGHKINKEPLSSSQKQCRNKRPDQPKYIPKPKIATQSPSPDPTEAGLDPCFLSLTRIRSPVQVDKNSYTEKLGILEKNQALEHQFQNPKSDYILAATQRDQNKSTNFSSSVIKPKQNKIDSNNYKTTRQSNSNPSQNWQNSDNKMNINNSRPNSSLSNKSYSQNSQRDSKSGRRFKKDRDSKWEENSSYQRGRFSRNSRKEETNLNNVGFTIVNETVAKHLVNENYKMEEVVPPPTKSNSSSPSRDNSINIKREESPKPISNVVFNSPKGRGRGRSQTILANATENRPLLSEIIITGRESSSESLPIFDYEAQGPRPTLIFESSHKITDWNQEVTDEENTINAAKGLADNGESACHYSITKRSNCLTNDNNPKLPENNVGKVQSKKDKLISDFQQNLPPRFHRSKDNLPTNEFNLRNDCSTPEKGIIKVNWKNIGIESRESPVNSLNGSSLSKRYQALEPVHYKTLYDPAHPAINHHTLHSNPVSSYPQPIVPRSAMPVNGFPLSAPPIVKNCRIPPYRERDHYPTQPHPNLPRNNNKLCATYPPYMIYGPVQSNSQVPPPQNGMFPQPYSETVIPPQDKRIKPIVEKNLCDIASLERELNTYLSKGLETVDQKTLGRCRWKIQLRYENIILADPRFCADKNVENALWKSTFHQVIEAYRKLKELHPSRQEEYNKAIINLVEEGTVFYESLLEKQQETFGINFTPYLDNDSITKPNPLDSVKLILISTQKLFICLGDLARYREQATNTSNYGKARSWYIKAQQIAPKNGRPYNQLAILAISARRKLDAVYYYMRSLAASNPFLSARESLLGLFDEARKKYEVVEKKKLEEKGVIEKSDKMKKGWKNRNNDRLEVWIHPSGIQHSKTSILEKSENSQSEISTVELNKRFVLSFLHVHGKLFTKVGMENFTETANQMLQEFKNLLQCSPAPLASVRLLQLLAINMFSVANTSAKGGPPMNSSERPLLQEQALQVSLAMMAIGIERSTILLKEHLSSPDYPSHLVSYDLAQLLPTIKVFTDWMSCQRNLWSPPPTLGDLRTGCKGDIWTLYANLLNELKKMKGCGIELKNTKLEGYDLVILPEDISLACFVPLLGAPQNPYYGQPPLDKERARTWLRIIRILFFGDYLCGISPPYLKFDVQTTSYVSLITSHSEENTESSSPNTTYNSSDEDETIEDLPEDCDEDVTNDTSDIGKLWHRQEALKKKKDREDRRKAQIQQVLRDHRTKRAIELQVTPKYLIPDTNCFIDHLVKIDLLLKSKTYNLVVPLIVINELDGLARGERPSSSSGFHQRPSSPLYRNSHVSPHDQQRVRQVGQAAKDAVSFLEEFFSTRDYRLKAITSKGNILDSISIRSEDIGDKKGTNDDLILSCCLHYCKNDKPSEYMPKDSDGPIHITREIVLLTDDRNLRVKAMTHNVPTRGLDEFLRWANIR